ncbi:hypothetical protein [Demequina globuliformis]|uniref:hypothetical protein n=1 Tax=Demequina globuliformis TaxID=676202 RepID=UPI0007859EFE|nr:hypothetical protein [Demequina globuliformis]
MTGEDGKADDEVARFARELSKRTRGTKRDLDPGNDYLENMARRAALGQFLLDHLREVDTMVKRLR